MSSPVAHECFSGKGWWEEQKKCERALPIPSPALLGSDGVACHTCCAQTASPEHPTRNAWKKNYDRFGKTLPDFLTFEK